MLSIYAVQINRFRRGRNPTEIIVAILLAKLGGARSFQESRES
jgi:hypothetical protein